MIDNKVSFYFTANDEVSEKAKKIEENFAKLKKKAESATINIKATADTSKAEASISRLQAKIASIKSKLSFGGIASGMGDFASGATRASLSLAGSIAKITTAASAATVAVSGLVATKLNDFFSEGSAKADELNNTINSFAALKTSLMSVTDENEKALSLQERYNFFLRQAPNLMREIEKEALRSNASISQLAETSRGLLPYAQKVGFNDQQLVQFSSMLRNATKAYNMPENQIGQEARAVLSGNITRNSTIANDLGLKDDAKYFELMKKGGQEFFDYILEKFGSFTLAAENASTSLSGTKAVFEELFSKMQTDASAKFSTNMQIAISSINSQILNADGSLTEMAQRFQNVLSGVGEVVGEKIGGAFQTLFSYLKDGLEYLDKYPQAINIIGDVWNSVKDLLETVLDIAKAILTPFVAAGKIVWDLFEAITNVNGQFSTLQTFALSFSFATDIIKASWEHFKINLELSIVTFRIFINEAILGVQKLANEMGFAIDTASTVATLAGLKNERSQLKAEEKANVKKPWENLRNKQNEYLQQNIKNDNPAIKLADDLAKNSTKVIDVAKKLKGDFEKESQYKVTMNATQSSEEESKTKSNHASFLKEMNRLDQQANDLAHKNGTISDEKYFNNKRSLLNKYYDDQKTQLLANLNNEKDQIKVQNLNNDLLVLQRTQEQEIANISFEEKEKTRKDNEKAEKEAKKREKEFEKNNAKEMTQEMIRIEQSANDLLLKQGLRSREDYYNKKIELIQQEFDEVSKLTLEKIKSEDDLINIQNAQREMTVKELELQQKIKEVLHQKKEALLTYKKDVIELNNELYKNVNNTQSLDLIKNKFATETELEQSKFEGGEDRDNYIKNQKIKSELEQIEAIEENINSLLEERQTKQEFYLRQVIDGKLTNSEYNNLLNESNKQIESDLNTQLELLKQINSETTARATKAKSESLLNKTDNLSKNNELKSYFDQIEDDATSFYNSIKTVSEGVEDAFSSSFENILNGSKSVSKGFKDMSKDILSSIQKLISQNISKQLVQSLFGDMSSAQKASGGNGLFGTILGSIMGGGRTSEGSNSGFMSAIMSMFSGTRAGGGLVQAGHAYLTSEAGPELFIPTTNGRVLSSSETKNIYNNSNSSVVNNFIIKESRRNRTFNDSAINNYKKVNEMLQQSRRNI